MIGAVVYLSLALGLWWIDGAGDGLERRVVNTASGILRDGLRRWRT